MEEAGITAEEVSKVLGLPDGVDPTSFNPYSEDADPVVALAVEKVAQKVMTTVTAVSSAIEGSGGSAAESFALALEAVVDVVKTKVEVVQSDPATEIVAIDFSDTDELEAVTDAVAVKVAESGVGDTAAFESVKDSLTTAVANVNNAIETVTDLSSSESWQLLRLLRSLKSRLKRQQKILIVQLTPSRL